MFRVPMAGLMKPSVGRIVRYVGVPAGKVYAAIVIDVHTDTCVDLHVFAPSGLQFETKVMFDETRKKQTWHWPERT